MPDHGGLPDELRAILSGDPLGRPFPVTPEDIGEISRAGTLFIQQGQWERAQNVFKALIKLAPASSTGFAGMGNLLLQQRKLLEALTFLVKAAGMNADDPYTCANLGETLLRMGKGEQAKTFLKAAIEMDPARRHPASNRARAMLEAIEDSAARDQAQKEPAANG